VYKLKEAAVRDRNLCR